LGTRASTSSRTTMDGLFSRACLNTSRILDSVSPWYADESSGPLIIKTDDFVDDAIARARCVLPVPGGPWSKIPRGGLRPDTRQKQIARIYFFLTWKALTESAEKLWSGQGYLQQIANDLYLLVKTTNKSV
jgi:hypothetical protein